MFHNFCPELAILDTVGDAWPFVKRGKGVLDMVFSRVKVVFVAEFRELGCGYLVDLVIDHVPQGLFLFVGKVHLVDDVSVLVAGAVIGVDAVEFLS